MLCRADSFGQFKIRRLYFLNVKNSQNNDESLIGFKEEKSMNKKLVWSLLLIGVLVMGTLYCGSGSGTRGSSGPCEFNEGDEIIRSYGELEQTTPPEGYDWVMTKPATGTVEGERVVFFYTTGEGADRTQAENAARAYAFGNLSESLINQVIKQFAEAMEAIGVGADQDVEAVSRSLVATRSRAEVSGALEYGHLTMKVAVVGRVNPNTCEVLGTTDSYYRCLYAMYIPYEKYQQLRDEVVRMGDFSGLNPYQQEAVNNANAHIQSEEGLQPTEVVQVTNPPPQPNPPPTVTPTPQPPPQPPVEPIQERQSNTRLYILNLSNTPIAYFYSASAIDKIWGDNLMGSNTVDSGDRLSLSRPPGNYNLKVEDRNRNVVAEVFNVQIRGDVMTWVIRGRNNSELIQGMYEPPPEPTQQGGIRRNGSGRQNTSPPPQQPPPQQGGRGGGIQRR